MKNPTPKKTKAPTVAAVGALKRKQTQIQFSANSTATEAQRQRILTHLRIKDRTTEDLRRLGIYQVSTRIFELRELGYNIVTSFVTLTDEAGFTHSGCALYTLVAEPEDGERSQ